MAVNPRIEHDRVAEALATRNTDPKHHPDLGFKSLRELETTISGLKRLLIHPETAADVIGKYNFFLEQQRPFAEAREIEDQSRRRFVGRSLAALAGVVVALPLYFTGSNIASDRAEQERRERAIFESSNTLGVTSPKPSYWGWSIRYARRQQNLSFDEVGILRLGWGNPLIGPGQSTWNLTGIKVYDYQRSDGVIVPKLHITTEVNPTRSDVEIASEEWLLRETDEMSDSNIDPRVVVMEKQDRALAAPVALYLSIRRVGGDKPFEVKIMKPTAR